MAFPKTENPAPEEHGVPIVVGFGRVDASENRPSIIHLQALRLRTRFRLSPAVAEATAELAYGRAA